MSGERATRGTGGHTRRGMPHRITHHANWKKTHGNWMRGARIMEEEERTDFVGGGWPGARRCAVVAAFVGARGRRAGSLALH